MTGVAGFKLYHGAANNDLTNWLQLVRAKELQYTNDVEASIFRMNV